MKKVVLSLGIVLMACSASMAQNHGEKTASASTTPAASNLKPENMEFKQDTHDFGTIEEGPAAEHEFVFKNTGTEPILIQQVHASCGCTTPSYSKDPVLPGKTGIVKASFNTKGRGGAPFNKSITITSNAGTKVVFIKGTVEKAPESSVPENTSMIRTN